MSSIHLIKCGDDVLKLVLMRREDAEHPIQVMVVANDAERGMMLYVRMIVMCLQGVPNVLAYVSVSGGPHRVWLLQQRKHSRTDW